MRKRMTHKKLQKYDLFAVLRLRKQASEISEKEVCDQRLSALQQNN